MTKEQFKSVTDWQNITFPIGSALAAAKHLREEVDELIESIEKDGTPDKIEIADCYMLLFAVCNRSGISYEDVVENIDLKMKINKERKWDKANEHGYFKHLKNNSQNDIRL